MQPTIRMQLFISCVMICLSLTETSAKLDRVKIDIDFRKAVKVTSENFVSVQFDSGMIQRHWKQLNFSSQLFTTLCSGLSPAYVRIGGTAGDMLHFVPDGQETLLRDIPNDTYYMHFENKYRRQPFIPFNMTGKQFDQLFTFFYSANMRMIFGLNALIRRGNFWDPSNAKVLLDYVDSRQYGTSMDFQLGNEPNDFHKYNFSVAAADLATDFLVLREVLDSYSFFKKSHISGPDTTRPRNRKALKFLDDVVKHAAPVLDAVTWHQYYTNGRTAHIEDFMDPDLLDELPTYISNVSHCVGNYKLNPVIWLGETSSTFGGGTKGLSDRYVAGFMWLDKLGLSAKLGISVVIRQAIIGGNYALIHDNFSREKEQLKDYFPNPDYWLTYIFKVLVGKKVLNVTVSRKSKWVRMYAHCTNVERSGYPRGAVTVYGLNLLNHTVDLDLVPGIQNTPIEQYLLTPYQGDLTSSYVELNGKKLEMVDETTFPTFEPHLVKKMSLPPRTFGFFILSETTAAACMT